jgi:hypothetical protein
MSDQSDTIPPREDVSFVGEAVALGDLFAALAKAQGEFLPLGKESTAEVKNKEGKFLYNFDYCPLDGVIAATRTALSKYGLALIQLPNGNELLTVLAHGPARIESRCYLSAWETPQQFGGVLTYFKRYAMLSLLAVFPAGEDDDANQAQGNQAAVSQRPRATPPSPKATPATVAGLATTGTINRNIALSKAAGHKNTAELNDFSRKEGCGDLNGQTEENAKRLLAALEKLQVQP